MSIPGYTVSLLDIENEFGGSGSIAINEYYRDTSGGLNAQYVVGKQGGSDYGPPGSGFSPEGDPNTSSIPSSGSIDFASFRNTTCLLGFNRYYCPGCSNDGRSLHFYSCQPGQENLTDYSLEQANFFYIFSTSFISGTVPLYRFFDTNRYPGGGHIFTTNFGEGSGMNYENIKGYVRTYQTANSVPIYRGYNGVDYFYVTNPGELGGYNNEGIQFYAYTNTNWRA